jgi:hypothetical protein
VSGARWEIIHADCRDAMRAMDADSVDSIVSDPPYGLSFMGKEWDHGVPSVEFWLEAYRVAKPGAYLLAFGGSRTYHRLTCAIEDAGFEIRDCLQWLYASGFPKSLDVSKAIDKLDAAEKRLQRAFAFTAWVRSTGVTAAEIDRATNTAMGNHYTTHPTQPAIATRELFEQIRPLLNGAPVPDWVEALIDNRVVESDNFRAREVVAVVEMADSSKGRLGFNGPTHAPEYNGERRDVAITTAHTAEAQAWEGWGTALKPAFEPIIVARKPLRGTVAANVVAFGTGAINIDACRIPFASDEDRATATQTATAYREGRDSHADRNGLQRGARQPRRPQRVRHIQRRREVVSGIRGTQRARALAVERALRRRRRGDARHDRAERVAILLQRQGDAIGARRGARRIPAQGSGHVRAG